MKAFKPIVGAIIIGLSATTMTSASHPKAAADGRAPLSKWVQVQGSALYLQRIALLPGSRLFVTVEDSGRADASAKIIATRIIKIPGVPARFSIRIPRSLAGEGNSLSLRLAIRDKTGLRWTSDRHIAIKADPFSNYIDVGETTLVSAR